MPKLIDADALKAEIESLDADSNKHIYKIAMEDMLRFFVELIDKQPTIELEVRHGRWESIPGMNNTVFCSECLAAANKELAMKYKGCPFCLARMDGGADNG